MNLSNQDLYLLCQTAISAAMQAGQVIAEYSQKNFQVSNKDSGDSLASQVVTEVDHLAEQIIVQILQPCCDYFDLALLSEETPDNKERLLKGYFWSIDPMDGTLSFVERKPGYAVSIALVAQDGTPFIGVIYDPLRKNLYCAIKGQGALRNGKTFVCKQTLPAAQQPLRFLTDRSFAQHPHYTSVTVALELIAHDLGYAGLQVLLQGGGAMNACQVLEQGAATYFKLPRQGEGGGSLWDYAATSCLFHEAQAFASDIFGKPLDLNRADSTYMNHGGVLYASDKLLAEKIMTLNAKLTH